MNDPVLVSAQLEHADRVRPANRPLLMTLIENSGLLLFMAAAALEVMPDAGKWRLTLTGDFIATINSLEARGDGNLYTVERGPGLAGARTVPRGDGTYDLVIDANMLFQADHELVSVEEAIIHLRGLARHLPFHEAGHALLHVRGEDANQYSELVTGSMTELALRRRLATHLDDFRIERMTRGGRTVALLLCARPWRCDRVRPSSTEHRRAELAERHRGG
jgi:hypothetical protein